MIPGYSLFKRGVFRLSALVVVAWPLRANPEFDRWADAYSAEIMRSRPQAATQAQYFSGAEQDALDRELGLAGAYGAGYGRKRAEEAAALARRGLEGLARFPEAGLTPVQRTSAAIIRWASESTLAQTPFVQHRFVFEQFGGLHVGLVNFLTQSHPIRRARDIENYLARLALVAPRIDEGIQEARAAESAGLLPPRFIVERTLEQLDGLLLLPPAENVFVASLNQRIGQLGTSITPDARRAAVAAAETLVRTAVIPAYRRVREFLAAQLPRSGAAAGAGQLPRGQEYYQAALAALTTTSLPADEIHAIGRREIARIEGEMDRILRELGYRDGSVKERFETMQAALIPPAEPDPRPAMVAEAARIVRDAERRAAAVFDLMPRSPVAVQREPAFTERTAAAHYSTPAPDGSKPGIYWLPVANLTPQVIWIGAGARTTAYHEAVPGHHFQLAIQQEQTDLPRFRQYRVFSAGSAFAEGWALYAERLADENGWYQGDPKGRLGYLNGQLFRARRLVVDTGLHAKQWTRQQAIDFGISPAEVERYVVWPGQACSYMIGQLRILEIREKAKAALGAKFAIKEFHNVILRTGNVPLDVLADEVARWVAARQR